MRRADHRRAAYNFGGNALKWFVISFFEPFVLFALIPLALLVQEA
ncbi:hypothetical protein Q9Q95_13875 [Sphingomonas sp. DG1-23]|nr:hypothetical protein [Sphingomonas sp. DG1-23]MDP5280017.1 hypothetical protein [Sphingomonas sp. DG1-23]